MVHKKHIYAVILVGGSGTRFWPQSRKKMPKQFLNITGDGTLFQKTLTRIIKKVNAANIYIVANVDYKKEILKQIASFKVPQENILLEPEAKNTAPAVCWVSARIHQKDPDAIIITLPSDHLILNQNKYERVLTRAIDLAQENCLVTLGIVPTRPETGYGYLRTRQVMMGRKKRIKVTRFVEKPDLAKAKRYCRQKHYYWNSGMFVWRSRIILQEFEQYLPDIYALLKAGPAQKGIARKWKRIQGISVDYGILERSSRVMAVEAKGIQWSDLGSWESLADFLKKDKNNNVLKGDVWEKDCSGTLIWGQDRFIATLGLKNLIIIDTPDALLVCPRHRSQEVKEVVNFLQKKARPQR